jgi:hypothetical protein
MRRVPKIITSQRPVLVGKVSGNLEEKSIDDIWRDIDEVNDKVRKEKRGGERERRGERMCSYEQKHFSHWAKRGPVANQQR